MATAPVTLDLSKSEPISKGVTLDLSKSQPINPSPPPGFLDSAADEAGKVISGQVESWKHGGGAVSSGGDPRQTLNETFNPFHPIQTAGYLVPQPVKDIYNAAKQGHIGEAAGKATAQAAPFLTSGISPETMENKAVPAVTSPVRGAAKVINAIGESDKGHRALGATGGAIVGRAVGHPFEGMILGGLLGQELIPKFSVPGTRFGLPPEQAPRPLFLQEGGTVSRGTTLGATPTGTVASPAQLISNPSTTRPEAIPAPARFAGGRMEPVEGPVKADVSKLGPPAGVGKFQPPERVPPPVRTPIVRSAALPEPEPVKPPQVSIPDQIATAKGLGFRNLNDAINKFGFEGWQKVLGQETPKPAVAEPPSVRPGSPTPFHSETSLTPSDLMSVKNTRIPTWDEVEREGRKERFYAEAPMVKGKTQLVNEVQPSIVAKSEATTPPYKANLKKSRR